MAPLRLRPCGDRCRIMAASATLWKSPQDYGSLYDPCNRRRIPVASVSTELRRDCGSAGTGVERWVKQQISFLLLSMIRNFKHSFPLYD